MPSNDKPMWSIREDSLNCLQWELGGSKALEKRLPSPYASRRSPYCMGSKKISEFDARMMELYVKKPNMWLDRDHRELLNMSTEDYELFQACKTLTTNQKALLKQIVVSFEAPTATVPFESANHDKT